MTLIHREEQGPTWHQLLLEGKNVLAAAGVPDPELDAWYLLSSAFGIDRAYFYLEQNRPLRTGQMEKGFALYESHLEKRAARIPLQQVLGGQEFMGLEFYVNEHVLIPRQDTEALVEMVLERHQNPHISILDMCTGSGCIAVSLAVLGKYESVTASDISVEALKVAKKNARRHFLIQNGTVRSESRRVSDVPWKLELKTYMASSAFGKMDKREQAANIMKGGVTAHRLILLQSDLFSNFTMDDQYDLIVSNPPYIPSSVLDGLQPEVRDFEPRIALDGTEDGLHYYRALALQCSKHLKTGGYVCFEIGYDQAVSVSRILAIAGYSEIETIKDVPGNDRVVRACWRH